MKNQHKCLIGFIIFLSICTFLPFANGLIITDPKSGSVFNPGDTVTVKAIAAPNEHPVAYYLFTSIMPFSTFGVLPPYELTFTIPLEFTGSDKIVASSKFSDGSIVETEIQIQVVLPTNISLESIDVDPNPVFLYKLPENSDPNDIRIFETKNLGVGGMYSDGVERWIASSSDGTTYASSDEQIVTVSPDGKMEAQGIGKAKITVKNGTLRSVVEVIVTPYEN